MVAFGSTERTSPLLSLLCRPQDSIVSVSITTSLWANQINGHCLRRIKVRFWKSMLFDGRPAKVPSSSSPFARCVPDPGPPWYTCISRQAPVGRYSKMARTPRPVIRRIVSVAILVQHVLSSLTRPPYLEPIHISRHHVRVNFARYK